ncbi:response regulator receiver protein [Alkaliphilus metalliredigens QYMF]|uniref:Stage 0 sporulation protein A homolog n=1 Tax=Alkaliphilus metalliredigens (strain QYMF) TaxID=293826 RepID=A6TT47_ALKMQ|nr:Na-translocating system protein MpsC family protein [Alkaliphilus metalliredigens]ABR49365.1 response regulator receiver protein [Alkaliphilus metalliredigens QYMF]
MSDNNLLKNLKVLYVEDEEEVMKQMEFFLKKRVGKLITAQNGMEGLAAFKENLPDLIISDLKMPIMDGIAMTRKIREVSDVPVVITTAFSEQDMILKAIDIGIEKYIIKPIDARELTEVMKKIAVKILRNKGVLLEVRSRMMSKEEKLTIEDNLKNSFGKFIKEKTGKGPKNVKVFMHGNKLEVEMVEVLTKFEKTMLEVEKNRALIRYYRETFYQDFEEEMKTMINTFLPCESQLNDIKIDVVEDKSNLIFLIC